MIRHRKEQELRRLMTQKAVLSAKDASKVQTLMREIRQADESLHLATAFEKLISEDGTISEADGPAAKSIVDEFRQSNTLDLQRRRTSGMWRHSSSLVESESERSSAGSRNSDTSSSSSSSSSSNRPRLSSGNSSSRGSSFFNMYFVGQQQQQRRSSVNNDRRRSSTGNIDIDVGSLFSAEAAGGTTTATKTTLGAAVPAAVTDAVVESPLDASELEWRARAATETIDEGEEEEEDDAEVAAADQAVGAAETKTT